MAACFLCLLKHYGHALWDLYRMEVLLGIDLVVVHISKLKSIFRCIRHWFLGKICLPKPANHRVTGVLRLGCEGGEQVYPTPRHHQPLTHWPKGPRKKLSCRSSVCRLPPGSSLGGCSQAVVGKSRTTGSIYLTSVSSTIAKHHQRAAAPPRNRASKRSSEESEFKRKTESSADVWSWTTSYERTQGSRI